MHAHSLDKLSIAELKRLLIVTGRRVDKRRPGLLGYTDQLKYAAVVKAEQARVVIQERIAA